MTAAAKNVRTRIENVKSSLNEAGKSSAVLVLASTRCNSHRMPTQNCVFVPYPALLCASSRNLSQVSSLGSPPRKFCLYHITPDKQQVRGDEGGWTGEVSDVSAASDQEKSANHTK